MFGLKITKVTFICGKKYQGKPTRITEFETQQDAQEHVRKMKKNGQLTDTDAIALERDGKFEFTIQ